MSPFSAPCVICTLCMLSITVVHSCEVYADQAAPDGCGLPGKLANFQGRSQTDFWSVPTDMQALLTIKLLLGGFTAHTFLLRVRPPPLYTMSGALQGTSSATTTWWLESRALSWSCKRKFKPTTTSKRSVLVTLGGSNSFAAARTVARSISSLPK